MIFARKHLIAISIVGALAGMAPAVAFADYASELQDARSDGVLSLAELQQLAKKYPAQVGALTSLAKSLGYSDSAISSIGDSAKEGGADPGNVDSAVRSATNSSSSSGEPRQSNSSNNTTTQNSNTTSSTDSNSTVIIGDSNCNSASCS